MCTDTDTMICNKIGNKKPPVLYNNNNLASDKIDTIILGGGGYLGVLYFGLIKLLDTEQLYSNIKCVYGVSVGAIFALLIILKYSYNDALKLLDNDFDLSKFINFNGGDILNLPVNYGLVEPTYIEQSIKSILEKHSLNPYITLEDLYNYTGVEFNLGVTLALQNKFQIINHITRPDLPVWLAIRMSANIPIIFNPVKDHIFNDFVYDGGHLNNNPIKYYLDTIFNPITRDAYTQTEDENIIEINSKAQNANELSETCIIPQTQYKYRMNFICIDLKLNRMPNIISFDDLNNIKFIDYLTSIINKYTYNQDSYKPKYQKYILSINCNQFHELAEMPLNISTDKIKEICDNAYDIIHNYYINTLRNT